MLSQGLVHPSTAALSARALFDAEAFIVDFNRRFSWKSGIVAPCYTDCRRLNLDPGARGIVKRALGTALRHNFPLAELVVGIAEAGVVWSAYAADEVGLPHAFVRKSVKKHGPQANKSVECSPPSGLRVVIVDDLLASGGSVVDAVRKLREEKDMEVLGVLSIVNWDFAEARDAFHRERLMMRALVSYPQIVSEAADRGLVTAEQRDDLTLFYQSPRTFHWPELAEADHAIAASSNPISEQGGVSCQ